MGSRAHQVVGRRQDEPRASRREVVTEDVRRCALRIRRTVPDAEPQACHSEGDTVMADVAKMGNR